MQSCALRKNKKVSSKMRVNAFKLQYFTLLRDVASNSSVLLNEEKIKKIRSLKRRSKEEKEQLKLRRCGSLRYSNF